VKYEFDYQDTQKTNRSKSPKEPKVSILSAKFKVNNIQKQFSKYKKIIRKA